MVNDIMKKFHVGAYGIIKNNRKIALILKARGPYTGKLDLPGGSIEYGETFEECLIREIKEELQADVIKYSLRTVIQNSITYKEEGDDIALQHIGVIFDVEIRDNEISDVHELDVLEAKWHEIAVLEKSNLTFLAKYAVEHE